MPPSWEMPEKGSRLGQWVLAKGLAEGGNSRVWLGKADDGTTAAVKVLKPPEGTERYERFAREVQTHASTLANVAGVLPVLDYNLPDASEAMTPPWLAMPIADPLVAALGDEPSPAQVLPAILEIARTLADLLRLHGISHRDIKPQNLYWFGGQACIGDFGLVTGPESSVLTRPDRDLGPRDYLAPEMRRNKPDREGPPADVFSLALTAFGLLGGSPPRDGLREDVPEHRLETVRDDPTMYELDLLLFRATAFDPRDRPTMEEFARELGAFLNPPAPGDIAPLDTAAYRARLASAGRHLQPAPPPQDLLDAIEGARSRTDETAEAVWTFLNGLGLAQTSVNTRLIERLDEEGLGFEGGSFLALEHDGADGAVWIGAALAVELDGEGARFLAGWVVAPHDGFPNVIQREAFRFDPRSIVDLRKLDAAVSNWSASADGAVEAFASAFEDFVAVRPQPRSSVDDREPWLEELDFRSLTLPNGQIRVVCRAHIVDDASGVAGRGYTSSPSQVRLVGRNGELLDLMLSADGNRVSGTRLNGFYEGSALVRPDQPDGVWRVEYVLLADSAGHSRHVHPDELEPAGFATEVAVER